MKQALSKMVELMAKDPAHRGRTLCITHCNCLERAFQLKEMALKSCSFGDRVSADRRHLHGLRQ